MSETDATRQLGHLASRPRLLRRPDDERSSRLRAEERSALSRFARRVRVIRRGLTIFAWTFPCMLVQAVLLRLPGQAKVRFPMLFWRVFIRTMGIKVRLVGTPPGQIGGRPVLYVSNHTSWVDIPVLGSVLDGSFVAKGDVAHWPLVGTIARLGRAVFVSRQRASTGREKDQMREVLDRGDNLILFPEGTSSDGSRTLPFRSSFLSIAEARPGTDTTRVPMIQPVSVVYDKLGGLPIGRAARPVFAWYGDMDIGTHFWQLAQNVGLGATVVLHAPMDPLRFSNRKALTQAVWDVVADGAATLRQNRPPRPIALDDRIIGERRPDGQAAHA